MCDSPEILDMDGFVMSGIQEWDIKEIKTKKSKKKSKKHSKEKDNSNSDDRLFNLHVNSLKGDTYTIKAYSDMTVLDLMESIYKQSGVKPEMMVLVFKQHELPVSDEFEVTRLLSDFNLTKENTMHIILRNGYKNKNPLNYNKDSRFSDEESSEKYEKGVDFIRKRGR